MSHTRLACWSKAHVLMSKRHREEGDGTAVGVCSGGRLQGGSGIGGCSYSPPPIPPAAVFCAMWHMQTDACSLRLAGRRDRTRRETKRKWSRPKTKIGTNIYGPASRLYKKGKEKMTRVQKWEKVQPWLSTENNSDKGFVKKHDFFFFLSGKFVQPAAADELFCHIRTGNSWCTFLEGGTKQNYVVDRSF